MTLRGPMSCYGTLSRCCAFRAVSQLNEGVAPAIAHLPSHDNKKARFQLRQNLASEEGDEKLIITLAQLRLLASFLPYNSLNRANNQEFFREKK